MRWNVIKCFFFSLPTTTPVFLTISIENWKWCWFSCQIILENFEWVVAEIERNEMKSNEMNRWILQGKSDCFKIIYLKKYILDFSWRQIHAILCFPSTKFYSSSLNLISLLLPSQSLELCFRFVTCNLRCNDWSYL